MYVKLTAIIHQFWAPVITFHFYFLLPFQFSLVQSLSPVRLFVTLSVATKYRNHYKGRDLWLILGNSAPLLLKIFLILYSVSLSFWYSNYVYLYLFILSHSYWIFSIFLSFLSLFFFNFTLGSFYCPIFKLIDFFLSCLVYECTHQRYSLFLQVFWLLVFPFDSYSFLLSDYHLTHLSWHVVYFLY